MELNDEADVETRSMSAISFIIGNGQRVFFTLGAGDRMRGMRIQKGEKR